MNQSPPREGFGVCGTRSCARTSTTCAAWFHWLLFFGIISQFFKMGFQPIFCLCGPMDIGALLESTLTGLGYELVDLELVAHGRSKLLRLFIDKPGGVNIDDCTYVSNHVSRLLAVELDYDYSRLEVSSPGLDRPLRKEADFIRFAGERAKIKLRIPLDGSRKFSGKLVGVENGAVKLDVEGTVISVPLENVDKARLVPQF